MAADLPPEVLAWLESINLMRYADAFGENGYDDLEVIADLDDDDLMEIKVLPGHRKKLLMHARKLKEGGGAPTAEPQFLPRSGYAGTGAAPALPHASRAPQRATTHAASPRQVAVPRKQIALSATETEAAGINRRAQEYHTEKLVRGGGASPRTGGGGGGGWASQTTTGNRRPVAQHGAAGISRAQQDRATEERLRASQAAELGYATAAGGGGGGSGVYSGQTRVPARQQQQQQYGIKYAAPDGTVDAKSNVASSSNPLVPVHKASPHKHSRQQVHGERRYANQLDIVDDRSGQVKYVQFSAESGSVDAKSNVASADNPLVPVHKVTPQKYREQQEFVRMTDGSDTQVYADARTGQARYVQFAADAPDPKSNVASADNPLAPRHKAW